MRTLPTVLFSALLALAATPAMAGTMTSATSWHPSGCKEPTQPPSLIASSPLSRAESINSKVERFNEYSKAMQVYMDCVSKEGSNDSASTSQAITQSAQSIIDDAQKKVNDLHDTLQPKSTKKN